MSHTSRTTKGVAALALVGPAVIAQAATAHATPADVHAAQARLSDMLSRPTPPSISTAMKVLPHSITSHSDIAKNITGAFNAPNFGTLNTPHTVTVDDIVSMLPGDTGTQLNTLLNVDTTTKAPAAVHVTADNTAVPASTISDTVNTIMESLGIAVAQSKRDDENTKNQGASISVERTAGQGTDFDFSVNSEIFDIPEVFAPLLQKAIPLISRVTGTDGELAEAIALTLASRVIPNQLVDVLTTATGALPFALTPLGTLGGALAGAIPLSLLGAARGALSPLNYLVAPIGAALSAPIGALIGSMLSDGLGTLLGFPIGVIGSQIVHAIIQSILAPLLVSPLISLVGMIPGAIIGGINGFIVGEIIGFFTRIPVQIIIPLIATGLFLFLMTAAGFAIGFIGVGLLLLIPALIGTVVAVGLAIGAGLIAGGIPGIAGLIAAVITLINVGISGLLGFISGGYGFVSAVMKLIGVFAAAIAGITAAIIFFTQAALPIGGVLVTGVWLLWAGWSAVAAFPAAIVAFLLALLLSPAAWGLASLFTLFIGRVLMPLASTITGSLIGAALGTGLIQPLKWIALPIAAFLGGWFGLFSPMNVLWGILTALAGRMLGKIVGATMGSWLAAVTGFALSYLSATILHTIRHALRGALLGGIPGGILGTLAALALLIPLSLATGPGLNQLLKHMMRMRWNMNGRDDQSRAERMTSEWFDRTNLGRILKGLNQVNDTVNRWVFTNIVKPFNQWLDGALGGIDWKAADEGKLLGAIVGGLTGIIAGAIPGATIGLLNPVNLLDALLGGLVTGRILSHLLAPLGALLGMVPGFLTGWLLTSLLHSLVDRVLGGLLGWVYGTLAPMIVGAISGAIAKGLFNLIPAGLIGIGTYLLTMPLFSWLLTKALHLLGDILFGAAFFLMPIIATAAIFVGIASAVWTIFYFLPVAAAMFGLAFMGGIVVAAIALMSVIMGPAAPVSLTVATIITLVIALVVGGAIALGFVLFWVAVIPAGLLGLAVGTIPAAIISSLSLLPYLGWRLLSRAIGLILGNIFAMQLAGLNTVLSAIPLFLLGLLPGAIMGGLLGLLLSPLTRIPSVLTGRLMGRIGGFLNPMNMLGGLPTAFIGMLIGQAIARILGRIGGRLLGGAVAGGLTAAVNATLGAFLGALIGTTALGSLGSLLGWLAGAKGLLSRGATTIPKKVKVEAPKQVAPVKINVPSIEKSIGTTVPTKQRLAPQSVNPDDVTIKGVSHPQLIVVG